MNYDVVTEVGQQITNRTTFFNKQQAIYAAESTFERLKNIHDELDVWVMTPYGDEITSLSNW